MKGRGLRGSGLREINFLAPQVRKVILLGDDVRSGKSEKRVFRTLVSFFKCLEAWGRELSFRFGCD